MRKHFLRIIILATWVSFISVLIYLVYGLHEIEFTRDFFQSYLLSFGMWAPIVYVGMASLRGFTFIPRSPLTTLGGFVFGPVLGSILSIIGIFISSTLLFWTAHYLGGELVRGYLGKRLRNFDELINCYGTRVIAACVLLPIFPTDVICYAAGLTKMSYRRFITVLLLCEIPLTLIYSILGDQLQEAERLEYAVLAIIIFAIVLSLAAKRLYRRVKPLRGLK